MRFLETFNYHGWELNIYKDEETLKFIGINGDLCFREDNINKSEIIQKFKRFIYVEKESPFNYSKSTLDKEQVQEEIKIEWGGILLENKKVKKKKEKFYKKLVKELCKNIDGLIWEKDEENVFRIRGNMRNIVEVVMYPLKS